MIERVRTPVTFDLADTRGTLRPGDHAAAGTAKLVRPGKDVTVLAVGGGVQRTVTLARELADQQIELEVLQPDAPRPSKVREVLRRLGVPLKGSDAEE